MKIKDYTVSTPTAGSKILGTSATGVTENYSITDMDLFTSSPIEVTYDELRQLISNSLLITNKKYIITDFQTIYDQPDFDGMGSPKTTVDTLYGDIEPLIVTAISTTQLNEYAVSPEYVDNTIKYSFDENITLVMSVDTKGSITYRKDRFNNIAYYDSRVILFKRYLDIDTGLYSVIKDNGEESVNALTFGAGCYNINCDKNKFIETFGLSNNIFAAGCYNIETGYNFYNNTILVNPLRVSSFGNECYNNVFLSGGISNTIGDAFQRNILSDEFTYNKIGNGFLDNTITGIFVVNNINGDFSNNDIEEFVLNNIGYGFNNNDIISFSSNVVGDYFSYNVIEDNCSNNKFFNNFRTNIIPANFQNNDIVVSVNNYDFNGEVRLVGSSYCQILKGFDSVGDPNSDLIMGYYDAIVHEYKYVGI